MLNDLYIDTLTRPRLTPGNSEVLKELVVLASAEGITDDVISCMIFIPNFFNADRDLSGMWLLKDQAAEMIRQMSAADILDPGIEARLAASLDLFHLLGELPSGLLEKVQLPQKSIETANPIIAVHIYANGGTPPHLREGYIKYGLQLCEKLRRIEHAYPERLWQGGLIIRQFTSHYTPEKNDPSKLTSQVMLRTMSQLPGKSLQQRRNFVDCMFSGIFAEKKTRRGGYHHRSNLRRVTVDLEERIATENKKHSSLGSNEEAVRQRKVIRTKRPSVESIAEGETPSDHTEIEQIEVPLSPFREQPDSLSKRIFMYSLYRGSHTFYWTGQFLKLYDLTLLHLLLSERNLSQCPEKITVDCFVESSINIGMSMDSFVKIKIGSAGAAPIEKLSPGQNPTDKASPIQWYYSPDKGTLSYVIPQAALGWYKETKISSNCRPSGVVFELKLPNPLNALYRAICDYFHSADGVSPGDLLFPGQEGGRARLDIIHSLKEFNRNHREDVSPDRLAKSYLAFYVGRYRLDPILASYVAARFDGDLRAQRFYTRCDPGILHAEYFRCYYTLRKDLEANSTEMAKIGQSVRVGRDVPVSFDEAQPPSVEDIEAFGSKVAAEIAKLKEFFSMITDRLISYPSCDDIGYHNLFCIYTYFVFQLSCCLRPSSDAPPHSDLIDWDNSLVLIGDKDSRDHEESRVSHIPPTTMALLIGLAVGGLRMRRSLPANRWNGKQPRSLLFYLIDEKGHIKIINRDGILKTLKQNGLEKLYDYPLNMPRHVIRTDMSPDHNSDLINAVMGHQRDGDEFANALSTASVEALEIMAADVQQMLEELGVIVIAYRK